MARRGNRTNPASAGRQALLDVPDSYVKPEEATKGLRRNRPKKAGQVCLFKVLKILPLSWPGMLTSSIGFRSSTRCRQALGDGPQLCK